MPTEIYPGVDLANRRSPVLKSADVNDGAYYRKARSRVAPALRAQPVINLSRLAPLVVSGCGRDEAGNYDDDVQCLVVQGFDVPFHWEILLIYFDVVANALYRRSGFPFASLRHKAVTGPPR